MNDDNFDEQDKEDINVGSQGLPEDNDPPFSDPDDVGQSVASDHPQSDSDIDPHEQYDEGTSSPTIPADDPSEDEDTPENYLPGEDQDKD